MIVALLIAGLLAAVVVSAIASGMETGVYCLDRVRLRVACEQREPAALRLEPLVRRPEDMVVSSIVGANLGDYTATACVTALLLHAAVAEGLAELYATAIVTPLLLVFGGVIPKDWFRRESNRLMAGLSWVLWLWVWLIRATGLAHVLRVLPRALLRWLDPSRAHDEAELVPRAQTLHLLREGAVRGGLTHFQRDVIERVLNLSSVRVSTVMIPRSRTALAPEDVPRADFLRAARMAHLSRLPIYRGDPRHIVGIVNVYDVLTDRDHKPIAAHARPPVTLGEYVSVSAALLKLQRARQTMAIVVDRSDHCVGILTLKDLVEEIVGDLEVW